MTRPLVSCCLFAWLFFVSSVGWTFLQSPSANKQGESVNEREESPEEQRERQIHERFVQLLKRSPRFGTALDRVYGYHIERGTLDQFVEQLQEAAKLDDSDGTEWMLLGLFEYQRGNDGQAVEAFTKAEEIREEDPLASYYLGRAYLLLGDDEKAAEAYERALAREPRRIDLMEIFQGLGRIYQRTQKQEKASEVWDRLETLFPDDTQVLEEIAYITAEEGDFENALKRYQKLAGATTEPYRRVQYEMQAGKMMIRLNHTDDAIELFEGTMGRLKPESWLHRDVRRQIEDIFLATDDYNGLTNYYEKWLASHDEDVEAMGRLAHILAVQGRLPEARQWYARAIKLSPSNTDLRESLISRLIDAAKYEQAIEQYEQLEKIDPGNPDYIEKWGQLVYENPDGNKKTQAADAATIWNKMLKGRENDPVIVTRVADLLRYAELTDDAIKLYQQAIELAPNNPQYREYLGEYYHILERTDEAQETWKQIAAGPRRNRGNLVRLAEVYSGFGFDEDALSVMKEACELDPEFGDRLQYAGMLTDAEQFDAAHRQLDLAREMAENDEELDNVLRERINVFLAANQLQDEIDKLQARLDGPEGDSADSWRRMAVYLQAISRADQAVVAVERSLALDANSIRTLSLAAALYESVGRLDVSVETYRKLSNLDRQFRSEYLQKIASLEMRLGRSDDALAAGEDLIASAPGNPENYSFYAELCFRLGKTDQGLDSLRRAVRANPSDPAALLTLAQALANQFRTPDAIELYWQAFEKSELLDDKLSVIASLTELYLRSGHFDRLIEKLEIKQRQGSQNRDITICTAAAYKNLGDFVKSKEILEQLLTEENRDVVLLQELVSLSKSANEYDDAARYQRRILELSPTPENEVELAQILLQSGEIEEAEALWTKLVTAEQDEHRVFRSLDQMIQLNKSETALAILEKLLRDDPDNWEALYRKGLALWKLNKKDESQAVFEKLIGLNLDDDELSSAAKRLEEQRKLRNSSGSGSYAGTPGYPPEVMRVRAYSYVQQILSNNPRSNQTRWSPDDYGQARVAAMSVGYLHAASQGKQAEYLAKLESETEAKAKTDPGRLWDLYYLQYANRQPQTYYLDLYKLGKRLSQELDDDAAKYVYLSSLQMRNYKSGSNTRTVQQNAEPLSNDEITHMLNCFEQLYHSQPDWLSSASVVYSVATELRIAGKEERANELYQQLIQEAQDEQSLGTAMQVAATAGNVDDVLELSRKGDQQFNPSQQTNLYQTYRQQAFSALLQKLIAEDRFDDVERLLFAQFEHQKHRYLSLPVYRRSRVQQPNSPVRVSLSSGGRRRTQTLTYPTPNPFFDSQDIVFVYTAFDGFRQRQKTNDLIDAFAERADADTDLDEVVSRLALAYVMWWSKDETTARKEIETVAKLYPNEPFLQLQLIDAYYRSKRYQDALNIANEVRATDRTLLEQREIIALKLAVQVGDLDRAREAAKRLFGMNLNTNLQIQLASQMNQLGMHELADAVLARTRRRAGNRSDTLVQLMQQYATKGNHDVANQIAMQIIRRSSPTTATATTNSSQQRAQASYRKSAIQQLNKTGELDKLIARLEEQLKSSPDSKRLNETLLDYYQSAGRSKEADEIRKRMRANLPDDPNLLAGQAKQLYSKRDYNGACDLYVKAVKLNPDILSNEYYEVQRSFDQAKRNDDFVKLFLSIDVSRMQQSYYHISTVANLIASMDNGKHVDDAVTIFQRAWKAFPARRSYLLSRLYADELWSHDVIYDYAREVLIPKQNATLSDPWLGLSDGSYGISSKGTLSGILSRVVAALERNESRRKQFLAEVETACKEHPNWHTGTVYRAFFDAKAGNTEQAQTQIGKIFDVETNRPANMQVTWMIGSELSKIPGMEKTAIGILKSIDANDSNNPYRTSGMSYDPRRLLVDLYQRTNQREKSRDMLLEMLETRDYSQYSSNPGYAEYQRIQDVYATGNLFVEMNYVIDAIRLFENTLADDAQMAAASRYGGSRYKERIETALKNARKKLTPKLLRESLPDWLPNPEAEAYTGMNLMLSVQPETLESATLKSLFEDSLLTLYSDTLPQTQVSGQPQRVPDEPLARDESAQARDAGRTGTDSANNTASASPSEAVAAVQKRLGKLKSRWPDVLTFPAIEVLILLPDQSAKDGQVKALEELLSAVKTRQYSLGKQKTATEQLVAVWLVARKALQSDDHRAAGEQLAEFVIDASEIIDEPKWVIAILRERGQIALDAGDPTAAERYWSLLLAHILKSETQLGNKNTSTRAPTLRSGTVAVPTFSAP